MAEAQKGKQMRYTEDEFELMKSLFKGDAGETVLKLLRKAFLPEYDPNAPLGEALDLWLATPVDQLEDSAALHLIRTRNAMIGHIEFQLKQLSILANREELTPEQIAEKAGQNSTQ